MTKKKTSKKSEAPTTAPATDPGEEGRATEASYNEMASRLAKAESELTAEKLAHKKGIDAWADAEKYDAEHPPSPAADAVLSAALEERTTELQESRDREATTTDQLADKHRELVAVRTEVAQVNILSGEMRETLARVRGESRKRDHQLEDMRGARDFARAELGEALDRLADATTRARTVEHKHAVALSVPSISAARGIVTKRLGDDDTTPAECPSCGWDSPTSAYPWWDGNNECSKCGTQAPGRVVRPRLVVQRLPARKLARAVQRKAEAGST